MKGKIKYRIRGTGPLANGLSVFDMKSAEAAETAARKNNVRGDHPSASPQQRLSCPWIVEARYVGPWEEPETARAREARGEQQLFANVIPINRGVAS